MKTFNTKKIDWMKQPMFFGEEPNVQRFDQQKYPIFEKLKEICFKGEPIRPITLYLKIGKSREIQNGEIVIPDNNFTLNVFDLSWRLPLF